MTRKKIDSNDMNAKIVADQFADEVKGSLNKKKGKSAQELLDDLDG